MLTIFDCDGVLVDSEVLVSEATAELLSAEGYAITAPEVSERFAGLTDPDVFAIVEEELGRALPDDFRKRLGAEVDRRMPHVRAIDGVAALIDRLDGPRCICSNTAFAPLKTRLASTGLFDRFKPYVFSAADLGPGRGKPLPDIFLHAARELETAPGDCVVIEDSVAGVTAAGAAGMRVIGFTGGGHSWPGHGEALMEAGAETVVRHMRDMAAVLAAIESWPGLA